MAKHVHETYSCDRCGADLGQERPNRSINSYGVKAQFGSREGPGPSRSFEDLCDVCDAAVKAFFIGTTASYTQPGREEKGQARDYFEGLLEAGTSRNTELQDHLLVRAYRMMQGAKP